MRVIHGFLLFVFALSSLLSCHSADGERYERVLSRAEQQNRTYDSITHVDSIHMAVRWTDRHGSANQRVRAHYLLGCAYRDMGEAPQALECYHDAADCADTLRFDCDYKLLSRLSGQIVNLLLEQEASHHALAELEKTRRYAHLVEDTLMEIISYEQRANAYKALNIMDSVIAIREESSRRYAKYGYNRQAALALGPAIDVLIDREEYKKAEDYLHAYETLSGVIDSNHNTTKRNKAYYHHKGMLFLHDGQLDSAEHYFRKEISSATEINDKEIGYKGLYHLYKEKHVSDSVAKYAMLAYETNDSSYRMLSTEHVQRMQAQYDYSRNQRKAEKREIQAERMRFYLILAISLMAVAFLSVHSRIRSIRQKRDELKNQKKELQDQYYNLQQAKTELDKLVSIKDMQNFRLAHKSEELEEKLVEKDNYINQVIHDKQQQISDLLQHIRQYETREELKTISEIESHIVNSEIVEMFRKSLTDSSFQISNNDWHRLYQLLQENQPGFLAAIRTNYPLIREEELRACILIRLHFSLKETAAILGMSLQALNGMRRRLLERIFHRKGGAKDFDTLLLQLN